MKLLTHRFSFVGVFFILISVLFVLFHLYKTKELNSFLDLQTKEAKHRYTGLTLFPKDTSNFIFTYLINTKRVRDIFKYAHRVNDFERDIIRNRLYKHLAKRYKELQAYDIQQLHFHLPNNDSFLRFHKPEKFGDNLTDVRRTVAYVNKNKVPIEGFEEGKIFNGYRFVYPLFDEKNMHIGSVEVSHSIKAFKRIYQRSYTNIALDILINKDIVKSKLFKNESKNYEPSIINDAFMHQKSMLMSKNVIHASESIKDIPKVKEKMKNFENFSIAIDHRDHKGVVSFIAIKNQLTQKNVAYAVSFMRSDYLRYFYEEKNKEMMYLVFVAFLITLIFYIFVRLNKELENKVYNDTLMNIYNRRFFEIYLRESCNKQRRNSSDLSLVMFDVDHFKSINDNYGHDVGDEALRVLAKVVKDHTRETDIFARWGGEEFMLLLEVNLENAQRVSENLRLAIQKYTRDNGKVPEFTCSFGIINLEGVNSLDDACKAVDAKLYEAKETGRNKVVV